MAEKENVYENATAGDGAAAQVGAEREYREKELAPIAGKFKSVDALETAYANLQAEFTRKSQRLKELERLVDNSKKEAETDDGAKAVEKLRQRAKTVKAEQREFDRFVARLQSDERQENDSLEEPETETTPKGPTAEEEIALSAVTEGEGAQKTKTNWQAEEQNGRDEKESVAKIREIAELDEEELFRRVKQNEGVRLKIIGEYLDSVKKAEAPLMRGGAGTLAAPPLKAKSVEQAGDMALRWLQREKVQA